MTSANWQKAPAAGAGSKKRRPAYRPLRAFLALAISAGGLFAALVKAFPDSAAALSSVFLLLDGSGPDGEPGFFGRIPGNAYIEMMVSLLVLVLLYSFLQLYGVSRDFRWFAGKAGIFAVGRPLTVLNGFFAVLTGRPKGFYAASKPGALETDKEQLASHLKYGMPSLAVPMRFFLWSFPMLGFLGTAIGLSNAIRLLPGAMGKGGGNALEPVLKQLSFKFDTTILGIVSALIVMLMIQFYERAWQDLEILATSSRDPSAAELGETPKATESGGRKGRSGDAGGSPHREGQ